MRPHLLALLLATMTGQAASAQGKNLLFYGNSYSSRNGSVADLVQLIAIEAGEAVPTVVKRFAGGSDLEHHATNSGQVNAISTALPAGQRWDHVIMQGQSLEATQTLGDPALFRQSAVAIMGNVRAHSPNARAVLYQTWARAIGHFFYPGTFAGPLVMHDQIRDNYRLARADIEAAFGAGTATASAVGDGVALLEFDPAHYEPDLFHPAPAMTLLASMCLYTSIYGQRICELEPDFAQPGPLVNWLAGLGLGRLDWTRMAGLADRSADPALRALPGSGDQLLLESGSPPGPPDACGSLAIGAGSFLGLQVRSLNAVFDAVPALLLVNLYPNVAPPPPSMTWPELKIDTGSMLVLASAQDLQSPLSLFVQLPFSLPGVSVRVQGLCWAPSTETGNPAFVTTDGHVLTFQ